MSETHETDDRRLNFATWSDVLFSVKKIDSLRYIKQQMSNIYENINVKLDIMFYMANWKKKKSYCRMTDFLKKVNLLYSFAKFNTF